LGKKHGVKILGQWTDFPQHQIYTVMEGRFEAMQKFMMEPELMEWLSWNTMETKAMLTNEEVLALMKKITK